jgi:hypothetical protein
MNVQPSFPTFARQTALRQLIWLSLILVLLLSLIGIQPAQAAGLTLVVDTTSDANLTACTSAANDCSLRGAINAANAAGGTNTISFDGTIFFFGGGIVLTSNLPTVTSTIIINGLSTSTIVINGSGAYSLFYVDTDDSGACTITLSKLDKSVDGVSFEVTDVFLDGSTYDAANSVTSVEISQ